MIITSELFVKDDKFRNQIILRMFYDEQKNKVSANIYLKLASEKRRRLIGAYHYGDNTLYVRRDSSKHILHTNRSFGFNWDILNEPIFNIKEVHLTVDDSRTYLLPKHFMLNYGSFLNFKKQGFELQKFIPFELIKRYEINKKVVTAEESDDYNYESIL
jgi:hypothetical protein